MQSDPEGSKRLIACDLSYDAEARSLKRVSVTTIGMLLDGSKRVEESRRSCYNRDLESPGWRNGPVTSVNIE
jgi:hypothetical protein